MQDTRWFIVCYDVRDPKRLRKCAKHMEGYGHRVQYSVFRCWMTPKQVQRLGWELTSILTTEDDVLMIPLCDGCVAGIQCAHTAIKRPDWPKEPPGHKIV